MGFVCCNDPKGSFTCMSSAACIQPMISGADATTGNMGDDATAGGDVTMTMPGIDATAPRDSGTQVHEASVADTSAPPHDTGAPPPEDTGAPPPDDTGAPPAEAGGGSMDANTTD